MYRLRSIQQCTGKQDVHLHNYMCPEISESEKDVKARYSRCDMWAEVLTAKNAVHILLHVQIPEIA